MRLLAWLLATAMLSGALTAETSGGCSFYCFHLPKPHGIVNVDIVKNLSCSHLVYGFAEFGSMFEIIPVNSNDIEYTRRGNYDILSHLKVYLPISILLGIRANRYLQMMDSEYSRSKYAESLFRFADQNRFNGFMFDFTSDNYQSRSFVLFLQEIHEHNKLVVNPIQIVVAVGARHVGEMEHHWKKIAPYVDAVYMVAEDIPSVEVPRVALQQHPLNENAAAKIPRKDSIVFSSKMLVSHGVPREKIVIGLTAWSRSYTLKGSTTGHLAPVKRYGNGGPTTQRRDGRLAYYEMCKQKSNVMRDRIASTSSFLGKDDQWFSITEPGEILLQKLEYIRNEKFNGVGISSISGDDKDGFCDEGSMPIHKYVADHRKCFTAHVTRNVSTACTRMCTVRPQQSTKAFEFAELEPNWCSHVVISSVNLLLGGYIEVHQRIQAVLEEYQRWNAVHKPPVLLSIGENHGPRLWRLVIQGREQRGLLIERLGRELSDRRIDGVEISWTQKPLEAAEVAMLNTFVKELRQTLRGIIIVVTLTSESAYSSRHDMKSLSESVDYVILQGHRFRNPATHKTGYISPMFMASASANRSKTMEAFAGDVASWGMSPSKILIGMSAEGITMKMDAQSDRSSYVEVLGDDMGLISQGEICLISKKRESHFVFHENIGAPTLQQGLNLIAFENPQSVRIKTSWASMSNYGGVALYALEKEISRRECDENSEFSLIKSIVSVQVCDTCGKANSSNHAIVPSTPTCSSDFRTICTYRLPANNEKDPLAPTHIPFHQCTDMVVEGLSLSDAGRVSFIDNVAMLYFWRYTEERKSYKNFTVNTVATIHCNMTSDQFAQMINNTNQLIKDMHEMAGFHKFAGVQFQCNHVMTPEIKPLFSKFLQTLQRDFQKLANTNQGHKTVSLRIPASEVNIGRLYDISLLNRLDSIVLEAVEQNKDRTKLISHVFSAEGNDEKVAIETTLKKWVEDGLQRSRIILQIPTYAVSDQHITEGSPAQFGTTIKSSKQICKMLENPTMKTKIRYDTITSYLTTAGGDVLPHDTPQTVAYKVRFAQRERLGGIGLFNLNEDDFSNECRRGHYPLLNAVRAMCHV